MEKERTSFETDFFEKILKRCPDYADVVEILGGLYTRQGRIDDGLKMDRKLVRLEPDNAHAHYNLACSLALKRRSRDAIQSLEKAIELGYDDRDWMIKDPDLEALKRFPAFRKLAASIKASG